jgi:hypothetical protein
LIRANSRFDSFCGRTATQASIIARVTDRSCAHQRLERVSALSTRSVFEEKDH